MIDMTKRTNAVWFFVALLGGGSIILWVKSVSDSAWAAAIVAAGVVIALTIYYLLNDEDAPEEEGDNVYYLGLLFTLISLMVSLMQLEFFEGATSDDKVRSLLQSFGVALTSTIVGIAGRVLLQNWQRGESVWTPRPTGDESVVSPPPPDASTQDLDRFNRYLLDRIARDLTQGVNALARFHRIVRSHATDTEEYLSNHSKLLKQESIEFRDALQRNADSFALEIKSQTENTLHAVGISFNAVTRQAETLLEQFQSINDSGLNAFQKNLNTTAEQTHSLVEDLSAINEKMGKTLNQLESGFGQASAASVTLSNNVNQSAQSATVLKAEIDRVCAAFKPLHNSAENIKSLLDAVSRADASIRAARDAEQTAIAVQQIEETLRAITTESATANEHAAKSVGIMDALAKSVQTTEGEIQRAAEALRSLASEAEAQTTELKRHQKSGLGRLWNRN